MLDSLILNLAYTREQLERFACLSAIFIQNEITFPSAYAVDVLTREINPVPTDNDFCFLVALKASLLIVQNEIKSASSQSIRVTDGPSTIDMTSYIKGLNEYYKTLADQYEKAKIEFLRSGKLGSIGKAVLKVSRFTAQDGTKLTNVFDDGSDRSQSQVTSIDGGNA